MRKLLSLVLAFAMVLGTFAFPVSADGNDYQTVGEELKTLGVLTGDENGDLKPDQELTREEALVTLTRLMGKMDEAEATEAESGFTDVPAKHWAAKIIAYAKAQGWVSGKTETEFGLGQKVTTMEALSFMMRALGHKADWSKEDIMKKASELGLMEGVSAEKDKALIRGEMFVVMKNTLHTKPVDGKKELIYQLGLKEDPVPETLEVVEVKAENLAEVIVEFNQELDKDSLKDAFRFIGSSQGALTPKLQDDGKTVVVGLENAFKQNKKMYKLEIARVKSLGGLVVEKVVKEVKADDVEIPKIEAVVVTGPKNFDVVFSEPIASIPSANVKIKLDGKNGPSANAKVDPTDARKVNVTTSALKDGKTYSVLVSGAKDFAGYTNVDGEWDLTYNKVSEAPVAEVVSSTQEYVELKFDRPVKGLTEKNFFHTYSSWEAVGLFEDLATMNKLVPKKVYGQSSLPEYMDKVVVRFVKDVNELKTNDHPIQTGDVELNIRGKQNNVKVVDRWNNQLQDTKLMVSVTADKEAPVVESVDVTGENTVEVTFSKVVNSKTDKDNFELLNENGSKISGLILKTEIDKAVVKLTVTNPDLVGKTVVLNIKDVKDATINLNKMVSVETQTITFGDKTFEGIKEASYKLFSDEELIKVRLKFDEAIDTAVASDAKNYKVYLGTTVVDVPFEVAILSDKIVELVFEQEKWVEKVQKAAKGSTPTYVAIKVGMSNAVTDSVGNKIPMFEQVEMVKPASVAPTVKSVHAVANDRVEVTFSETVLVEGGFVEAKFGIGALNPYSLDHDGNKVVLNFDEKNLLPSNPEKTALKLKYSGKSIESETGGVLIWDAMGLDVKDRIAPDYAKLESKAKASDAVPTFYTTYGITYSDEIAFDQPQVVARWNEVKNRYEVVVVYTEDIDVKSVQSTTVYTVNGWGVGVPEVDVTPNVVVIPLGYNKLTEAMFENISLTQNTSIKDVKGNALAKSESPVIIQKPLKKDFDVKGGTKKAKQALTQKVNDLTPYTNATKVLTWDVAVQGAISYLSTGEDALVAFKEAHKEAKRVSENSAATFDEIVNATKELDAKFDEFKVFAKDVAPALAASQANNVQAGTGLVDEVDFESVNLGSATHFVAGANKAELVLEKGQTLPLGKAVDFNTTKKHVITEAAIALVKFDAEGKVTNYEYVDLTGKKGVMTAAPKSLKIVDGTNGFTQGNDSSLLSPDPIVLKTYDSGNDEDFKIQFEQADATTQKMDVKVEGTKVTATPFTENDVASDTPSNDIKVTGATGEGETIKITVTIKEDGKVSRVIVKEITVQ